MIKVATEIALTFFNGPRGRGELGGRGAPTDDKRRRPREKAALFWMSAQVDRRQEKTVSSGGRRQHPEPPNPRPATAAGFLPRGVARPPSLELSAPPVTACTVAIRPLDAAGP